MVLIKFILKRAVHFYLFHSHILKVVNINLPIRNCTPRFRMDAPVLVVGVGGIGCELVKNLILSGFTRISLIDLDTIELSNLNRQFLFQQHHIGQSKALVAKQVLLDHFKDSIPSLEIEAFFGSIFDTDLCSFDFFARFKVVYSALDNLEARRHLNKMCLAVGVPIVESGSASYLGQVSATLNGTEKATECFDCNEHPVPTSWPVCTIRNTPSTLVHCVVWAKEFVFKSVFSANAQATGSYFEKQEANTLQKLSALELAHKLFVSDIQKVLEINELWVQSDKQKPIPLSLDVFDCAKTFQEYFCVDEHKIPTLSQCILMFFQSFRELNAREGSLTFDKDDEEALNFVVSAALIRASCYHIAGESKFAIKAIAGNIIPAVSTTNAIIAALACLNGIRIMKNKETAYYGNVTSSYLTYGNPQKLIVNSSLHAPNSACSVCSVQRTLLEVKSFDTFTIRDLIESFSQITNIEYNNDMEIYSAQRLVYDLDFEENISKSFQELGIRSNSFLTIILFDSQDSKRTIEIGLISNDLLEKKFSIRPDLSRSISVSYHPKKRIKIDKN
jgi:ubiquitin-like 1-activating enzyme E1 B